MLQAADRETVTAVVVVPVHAVVVVVQVPVPGVRPILRGRPEVGVVAKVVEVPVVVAVAARKGRHRKNGC